MTLPSSLHLRHVPRGVEHPYTPATVERSPRDPIAGQPTRLMIESSPLGAAKSLVVIWRVNGDQEQTASAAYDGGTEITSQWHIDLPSFSEGDRVSYFFVASPGNISSETFEFTVAGWHTAGHVLSWQTRSRSIQLRCEERLSVILSFESECTLSIQYEFDENDSAREENPLLYTLRSASKSTLVLETSTLRCVIHRNPYRLEIFSIQQSKPLWIESNDGLRWLVCGNVVWQIAEHWRPQPRESFFGFGQRYNAFDQRGQSFDAFVFDEYKNQGKRTYLPVPFFISSQGYGVYLKTSHRTHFDLAADTPDCAAIAADDSSFEFLLFVGQPKDIIRTFTEVVGKPSLPPKWTFGLWMSSNEWNSQAIVMEQVTLTERHRIPATVLVVEAWSDETTFYIFNDAQYQTRPSAESFHLEDFKFPADGLWPDPKGLVENLHQRGLKFILWQIPVLKALDQPHEQHDRDTQHALEQKYVVREADDTPYRIRPFWFRGGLVPDFTNPNAQRWWSDKRAYLINDLGIDGFKTDGGEHLWGDELKLSDGRTGAEVNNLFPNLYQATYNQLTGANRILFSRAGFTGTQTVSCHWAGDENSTFAAFRSSIVAGLTAGVSGIAFWGWDIAGFSGGLPSAELYLRATAMATFCPIMQYHSEFNEHRQISRDRTPWNVQRHTGDADVIPVFRYYATLRMNLLPYIWSEAIKSSRCGLPMMRALEIEFPDDTRLKEFPYQYLFGESLLVAPVTWEGATTLKVYLPPGEWYDFWSGERHTGPKIVDYQVPKHVIPVFARGGTVVALNLAESLTLGETVGNDVEQYVHLCFRAYPSQQTATFDWFKNPDSDPVRFDFDQTGVHVLSDLRQNYRILLPPSTSTRETNCL